MVAVTTVPPPGAGRTRGAAAQFAGSFADGGETRPGDGVRQNALAVVVHGDPQGVVELDAHPAPGGLRVPARVVQGLADDPIGGHLDGGRQLPQTVSRLGLEGDVERPDLVVPVRLDGLLGEHAQGVFEAQLRPAPQVAGC